MEFTIDWLADEKIPAVELPGVLFEAPQNLQGARRQMQTLADDQQEYWRRVFADGYPGMRMWINILGYTFDPRHMEKHKPFITWPVQDRALCELHDAIDGGHDLLLDKSRDMGASWLNVAAFVWFLLFVPDTPLLMASRKEEYVDATGNPDTLFWKADYLINRLPDWMRPKIQRRHMHLANLANGSVIDGESTNGDLGRGGRRKAILLDEFAAVENGRSILAATADATPCRIFNSTPNGRGNAFADMRFSGKVKVVTLHWKDHPAKGAGAVLALDEQTGKRAWTSPWYRNECARRTSRKEIAQELDIDYLASGESFFDLDVCQRLRASGELRPPLLTGELDYEVNTRVQGSRYQMSPVKWRGDWGKRRLSLWQPLAGESRPPQDRPYVAFVDVAHGQGASNSVIKIGDADAAEEVASFVCPDTPPHELARYAVALCRWFGGRGGEPLLGWEANGPGGIFGLEVLRLGYGNLLKARNMELEAQPQDARFGWHSTRRSKEYLLGDLRRALARGELTLHDEAAITEAEQYVYYASGAIGPSGLVQEADGARSAHGDRVIAAAGLVLCMAEQRASPPPLAAPPPGSFADRSRQNRLARHGEGAW